MKMTELNSEDIRVSYFSYSRAGFGSIKSFFDCLCRRSTMGFDAVHLPTGIAVAGKEIGDRTREGVLVELERRVEEASCRMD